VGGGGVKAKMRKLVSAWGELDCGGKHNPLYAASDIAEINRKLDILAAHVGGVPCVRVVTDGTVTNPQCDRQVGIATGRTAPAGLSVATSILAK